ncbi:cytotoxic translational repressor of toxin-antitoxin stability system [Nonomuraea turkmeniaca]|uniref:Cytotoxic translational repressor of toxin-antitoxin stability system n=1 Tax=Nonomuraea turkmeniaca TaxID=103838 RepID=A0A5S4F2T2_9ACTN|nr:cytotoxic translational repressor of toxin-antitoxin stability system [Nonomuraea turkmeniaca]TMR10306.1 cytotoxic translational repressor of toxin-antitoxin stability system [Nonomuraea turkmeniaca]
MTWPQPTREDHDRFCQVEGWRPVRNARGRTGTHHVIYELNLPDGRILRTRISHPVDRSTYGQSIWGHILRDQLQVDEATFWACVKDGALPDRGTPKLPSHALPADLVHMLISRVGLAEAEVVVMSKEDAVARLQKYWTEGV